MSEAQKGDITALAVPMVVETEDEARRRIDAEATPPQFMHRDQPVYVAVKLPFDPSCRPGRFMVLYFRPHAPLPGAPYAVAHACLDPDGVWRSAQTNYDLGLASGLQCLGQRARDHGVL